MQLLKKLLKASPFSFLLVSLLIFCEGTAQARPISYPQGWTLMVDNDGNSNGVHLHYSPSFTYSLGYKAEYWRANKWQFHGLQFNYLLGRWNKPDSQSNLYFKSGIGVAYSDKAPFTHKLSESAWAGIALDWENRDYYLSYENRATYAGDIDRFYLQKARVGFTPYVGQSGDLHTWLMLQIDHKPKREDAVEVTPLVRMFKGHHLGEIGMSHTGKLMVNWISRF